VGNIFGSGGNGGILGSVLNPIFGGASGAEQNLSDIAQSSLYSGNIQKFLPLSLRRASIDPFLSQGMAGIGNLLAHPGSLSPTVADAIRPQQANEAQSIAQNFRGLQSNQAGAAARGNLPVSIKDALASALNVAQERAMRESRMQALTQSGQLQRSDLEQIYKILDAILQFTSSGRGQAIQGLGAAAGLAGQRQQSRETSGMQLIGSILGGMGGGGGAGAAAMMV
jgi:hypothetical protein